MKDHFICFVFPVSCCGWIGIINESADIVDKVTETLKNSIDSQKIPLKIALEKGKST